MAWSKLFKIIYTREPILCDYCKKHEAKWCREQILKGLCHTIHLCSYHKSMKIKKIKEV